MTCKEVRKFIYTFADGELETRETAEVLEHLKMCPDCCRQVNAQQQLKGSIARVMNESKAPASVAGAVRAIIAREASKVPSAGRWRDRLHLSLAVAAAFAAAFWGIWQFLPSRIEPGAVLAEVPVTDSGPLAVKLADNVAALHLTCVKLGPAHHNPLFSHNPLEIAAAMGKKMGIAVLAIGELDLTSCRSPFESASDTCTLVDTEGKPHAVCHMIYHGESGDTVSVLSMRALKEMKVLKQRKEGGRMYALLSPHESTPCRPTTIVAWNVDPDPNISNNQLAPATYLVYAPVAPQAAIHMVEPLRVALSRSPELQHVFLAALE